MALKTPNLDDRKFQDLVSEARAKIPVYCPKWTDYNLSDPGITVIELFAWMTDILLYRLNRVPEKNYIKFMELIGLRLEPPKPAQADLTFRLSAPQPQPVTIPRGTQAGTVRTETDESIVFTTDADLTITLPAQSFVLTTPDNVAFTDVAASLKNPDTLVPVFEPVPKENNAFYLGYSENLSALTLLITIECTTEGVGIDPKDPPLAWEYWDTDQEKWLGLKLESDSTGGLNTTGQVVLFVPYTAGSREVNGTRACWIRCRAIKPRPRQRAYGNSPKIKNIATQTIGGTVPASHCFRVNSEILGRSDGTPGQKFTLLHSPVLSRQTEETLEIETEVEGEYESWQEVADFAASAPDDPHFTLDSVSGEIQFGPVIRDPDGQERRYGRIPPLDRQIRFTTYRWGGGVIGNVGQETVTVPLSSIPYIRSVTNFKPAVGGVDAETLERAQLRAPQLVRARTRAVTAEDFEYLALEASSFVARAKCLTAGTTVDGQDVPAGVVRLLLVPKVGDVDRPIPKDQLDVPKRIRDEVQAYLDERRLLGTRLEIGAPDYRAASVEARVKIKPTADQDTVLAEARRRLYRYINPVQGGPDGNGWPFGRSLSLAEIYGVIQGTPDINYVEDIKLFAIDPKTGERQPAGNRMAIPVDSLICSQEHKILPAEESEWEKDLGR